MILLDDEEIMSHIRDIYPEEIPFGVFALVTESIQAQLKKVVEWGDLFCVNVEHYGLSKYVDKRQRECRKCLQSLKKEAGL